jgi:hypothetical protein
LLEAIVRANEHGLGLAAVRRGIRGVVFMMSLATAADAALPLAYNEPVEGDLPGITEEHWSEAPVQYATADRAMALQ